MDARQGDHVGRIEAEVDHGADRLEQRGADPGRAATAQDQFHRAVPAEDHGRGHHRGHPQAGGRGVEPVRVQVVLAQHVVQHHPGAGDHVAGGLAVGRRQRGHVAFGVGHAGVGRAATERGPVARLPGGLQVLEGPAHGGEVGRLAPGARRRHLLGQEAQAPADQLATERRWRVGQHGAVPVGDGQRLPLGHSVRRQVLGRDQPLPRGHVVDDPFTPSRGPEVMGGVGRQFGQEPASVGIGEPVPGGLGPLAGTEQAPTVLGQAEDGPEQVGHRAVEVVEHHALVGQGHRRRHDLGQRQAPQTLVDGQVAGHRAGHRGRAEPGVEDLVDPGVAHGHGEEVGLGHRVEAPARGVHEEVEERRLPGGRTGQAEPTPAQAGHQGLTGRRCEPGGHDGVEGVAPGREDPQRGLTRRLVPAGDDGAVHHRWRPMANRPARSWTSSAR